MLPFGRYAKVEIRNKEGVWKTLPKDLDIRFSIHRTSSFVNYAHIAIGGLNQETRKELISIVGYLALNDKNSKYRFSAIRITAGYYNQGLQGDNQISRNGVIFAGDILTAEPTSPPEVWLNMLCWNGFNNALEVKNIDLFDIIDLDSNSAVLSCWDRDKDNTVADVINCLRDKSQSARIGVDSVVLKGFSEGWEEDDYFKSKVPTEINFNGTLANLCRYLHRIFPRLAFCVQQDYNSVDGTKSVGIGEGKGKVVMMIIDCINDIDKKKGSNTFGDKVVSMETGMIGIPKATDMGIIVDADVMLDPGMEIWDMVQLNSTVITQLNHWYHVTGITHRGHLRGAEWKTSLHLQRSYLTKDDRYVWEMLKSGKIQG